MRYNKCGRYSRNIGHGWIRAHPPELFLMIGPLRKLVVSEDGQTKPAGVAVVVLVLVFSSAALGYYLWKSDLGGGIPQMESPNKCYSCGYMASRKLEVGISNTTCPKCGKETFLPAYKCKKCGNLEVLNEDRGLKPPTKCTKCGGEIRHGG
jgi:hypothetical protein